MKRISRSDAMRSPGWLAQIACLMEVTARKPGNVHRGRDFNDSHYLDFLLSATAIAKPLDRARDQSLGLTILQAIERTRLVTATNTNLGIVLLLAPLAAVPEGVERRAGVAQVLSATTVQDAQMVYQAIRLANPGGLGEVADQDLANEPTVTLLAAMRMAGERDLIARQYANGFEDVFDLAHPTIRRSIETGWPLETALIATHLVLMSQLPDSLIARKCGSAVATESARRAADVIASDWPDSANSHVALAAFDAWLTADGHNRNPGATADLLTAGLFLALSDGTIPLPRPPGLAGWSAARQ